MNIETVDINSLTHDPANVRKHNSKNLEAIKASLKKFGMQKPIVVDEANIVIAGNGALEAARALGWDKINIVRSTLKGSNATAFAIADNRSAELADWDDNLVNVLQSLDKDLDLKEIGFDEKDLAKIGGNIINKKPQTDKACPHCGEIL